MSFTVLCGSINHETNTFVQGTTDRASFQERWEVQGEAVPDAFAGTETQLGGVIEEATRSSVEMIYSVNAAATPGGVVTETAFESYAEQLLTDVEAHRDELDGIVLPLHGAMVTEHCTDGEGELLARIRDVVGEELPIVATLDLHGNVSERMATNADAIVGFETYPHLDKAATGRRGMELLLSAMKGESAPTTVRERVPTIIYQPKAWTEEGPFVEIQRRARELENRDGILKITVFVGFYHADIPEMGVSIIVVTDDASERGTACARELGREIWDRREQFTEEYPDPETAVQLAKQSRAELDDDAGPVVMADFGSNPGGGGASDGTTLLREMLEQELSDAGWAIMHDPEALATCLDAGVRARVQPDIGGKTDDNHGDTLENVDGYVKAITDGVFTNTGTSHMGQGVVNDLGPTVRFQCGAEDGVDVVISGTRHSAFDAEIWRHVGITPERMNYLCIPSLIAFLGDYGPFAGDVILVDTPGTSAVNPNRFSYERIPRPVYPLDDEREITYPPSESNPS